MRVHSFLTGLFALIAALLVAVAPVQAKSAPNPMSGGYQLFEQSASEQSAHIRLSSLGKFVQSLETASEYVNATNRGVPDGWRPINATGAQVSTPRGFTSYRTPDGDVAHVSPSGLRYGSDPKFGNRVDHVLDHTVPNPNKPVHSVFNVQGDDALSLVDEAWTRRGISDPNDVAAFVVDMGRPIGTAGETSIRVVVRPGTTDIITAYPY